MKKKKNFVFVAAILKLRHLYRSLFSSSLKDANLLVSFGATYHFDFLVVAMIIQFADFLVIRSCIDDAYFLVKSSSFGKVQLLVITGVFPDTQLFVADGVLLRLRFFQFIFLWLRERNFSRHPV